MSDVLTALVRDVYLLRSRVADLEAAPAPREPTYQRVLHLVSHDFGVPVALLTSVSRRADIALARHVAFHVAHRALGYSMPRIGRLADRDHSSVCHGIHRIEAMCAEDRDFAARVAAVIHQIEHERSRA